MTKDRAKLYSARELCETTGVSYYRIRQLMDSGKLKFILLNPGSSRLDRRVTLEAWNNYLASAGIHTFEKDLAN